MPADLTAPQLIALKKHSASHPVVHDDKKLLQLIYDNYRRTGMIVPQTPEDVARAEAEDARSPVKLPPRLRQPDIFGEAPCAAKEEDAVSPEIEARMEQDRSRAEREANKEDKPFK